MVKYLDPKNIPEQNFQEVFGMTAWMSVRGKFFSKHRKRDVCDRKLPKSRTVPIIFQQFHHGAVDPGAIGQSWFSMIAQWIPSCLTSPSRFPLPLGKPIKNGDNIGSTQKKPWKFQSCATIIINGVSYSYNPYKWPEKKW